MAGDPNYASVVLLVNFDGANGATAATDGSPSPKSVGFAGGAQLSTAQAKFGPSSLLLDGADDVVNLSNVADFVFGTGDFTIELWFYAQKSAQTNDFPRIIAKGNFAATGGWNLVYLKSSGELYFDIYAPSTISTLIATAADNTWNHVAISRQGTNLRTFLNGVAGGTATNSTNLSDASTLSIGAEPSFASDFKGYIDDVRLTKGVARYTAAFTPPTAAFPAYAGRVSGTVMDAANSPASRIVRVHRRDTGAVLASTVSSFIWETASEWSTGASDSPGWATYTLRVVISAALINPCKKMRLTLRAASANSCQIGKAYIGEAAASGDAYDFASTPTQLLFSGAGNVTIAAGASVISDVVDFVTDGTKNLVVSIYFSGTSSIRALGTLAGWSGYYATGDSAATVNASGYTVGNNAYCVTKIESSNADPGEYACNLAYAGEVQVIALDDDAGSLENDLVLRTLPI